MATSTSASPPAAPPETQPKPQNAAPLISPWIKVLAGSLGGAMEAVLLQPLDVTKTRLQLDSNSRYRNSFLYCAKTIYKEEGAGALYKGLTPFVTHLTLKYALRMGSFTFFRGLLGSQATSPSGAPKKKPSEKMVMWNNFGSGLCAGVLEAFLIVTPFEVIKTRLQQQEGFHNRKYKNTVHAAVTILREEGVRALWKGVAPTALRNGSNQACNFMVVGIFNKWVWKKEEGKQIAVWKTMISGAIAGAMGPCLNCPLDVIKTRLMGQKIEPGQPPKYRGVMGTIGTIYKEEGLFALWKGLVPRLMRLAPGQAIMWTVVTRVTTYFEEQAQRRIEEEQRPSSRGGGSSSSSSSSSPSSSSSSSSSSPSITPAQPLPH